MTKAKKRCRYPDCMNILCASNKSGLCWAHCVDGSVNPNRTYDYQPRALLTVPAKISDDSGVFHGILTSDGRLIEFKRAKAT